MAKAAGINLDNYMRLKKGKRNPILPSEIFNQQYQEILSEFEDCRDIEKVINSDKYFLINKIRFIQLLKSYREKHNISQKNY